MTQGEKKWDFGMNFSEGKKGFFGMSSSEGKKRDFFFFLNQGVQNLPPGSVCPFQQFLGIVQVIHQGNIIAAGAQSSSQ